MIRLQVAFLTGQSDPGRCALSPLQSAFLDALPVPEAARVRLNFPYVAGPAHREVALLRASWNNVRQYLASRRPEFGARHRPAVLALLERAERTLLLAGSCGLELLANLDLPAATLGRVDVVAYGPVGRHQPACSSLLVQGRRDWVSRVWYRGPVDARIDCDHLGYLETRELRELCHAVVDRLLG